MRQASFFDTEPARAHVDLVFASKLREDSKEKSKMLSTDHMVLKTHDELERLFELNNQPKEAKKIRQKKIQ